MFTRFRVIAVCAALALCVPNAALAHASGRGFVLLLPTEAMQFYGALAVAISFALIAFVPAAALRAVFRDWTIARFACPRIETLTSLLSLAFWAALVVIGFKGARDPLANPLPLTVWTLVWIALPMACALAGNLWALLNPWSGLARLFAGATPPLTLPPRLGYAPAILGLLAFGWFEMVDLAPDDPARLARAVALYSLLTLAAMLTFGVRDWMERGEFLNVFFAFIARLAPLRFARQDGDVTLTAAFPGAGLVHAPALPVSGALFILCALATVSFDGLSETWWWLTQLGINVLEFPGRSAVVGPNTLGLLAASVILASAFLFSLTLGVRLAPPTAPMREIISRLALSILPISLAYHFAHYLTALLVNGQYALATATDPLATGADWLGLGQFYVTTSFLNAREDVEVIWLTQSWAIIIGHIIAVAVAHRIALDLWSTPKSAARAQLPLAALMVAFTAFGLWLLASPTA